MQGHTSTLLNSVYLCAHRLELVLKWGIYVKIAVNVGYVLGGVLLTDWMDKLSAVSLFLFALKLTFLQGELLEAPFLHISHSLIGIINKQRMQVCQKTPYIKHSKHQNGGQTQ